MGAVEIAVVLAVGFVLALLHPAFEALGEYLAKKIKEWK